MYLKCRCLLSMKQGVSSELITVEGADHVFDQNYNDPRVQDAY